MLSAGCTTTAPAPAPKSCIHSRLSAGSRAARRRDGVGGEMMTTCRASRGADRGRRSRRIPWRRRGRGESTAFAGSRGRRWRAPGRAHRRQCRGARTTAAAAPTWLCAPGDGASRGAGPSPRKPSITWRWASMISRVLRRYSSTAVSRIDGGGRRRHQRRGHGPQRAGRKLAVERAGEVAVDEPGRRGGSRGGGAWSIARASRPA